MSTPFIQTSFNAGELSPGLYGRVDLQKYRSGCSTLRNMFANYRGGASSRAGTKFCGQSKQDGMADPPVLIPFQFSVSQGYALEFGEFYMRVIDQGAYVTEDAFSVTSASNANPGVFIAAGNDFAVDDWVFLSALGGMIEVDGGTYVVNSIPTTGSFTLKNTLTGAVLNTTNLGAYTTGGTAARIFTLDTPYAAADLPLLKWAQSADVMSLVHPSYPPADLARISLNDWALTTTSFASAISPPATVTADPTNTASSTLSTHYSYVVTAVGALTGAESVSSDEARVDSSVDISVTAGSILVSWVAVTGAEYYNIYKAPPSYQNAVPVGSVYGYAGSSFGLSWADNNVVQDASIVPPTHVNPFAPSAIDYFTITATGSGYTTTTLPTVIVTDSTGSGASGKAVVVGAGVFAIVVTDAGQNYTNPSVSIVSGGTGSGATFSAVNFIFSWTGSVNVNSTGSNYNAGVQVFATYSKSGSTITQSATSVTVGAGHITAVSFAAPAYSVPASTVHVFAIDTTGTGAAATAHIGPSTGTYPSVVSYFQDRRFYADSTGQPDTYWGSQPGLFTNFDTAIPVVDSDAITGTPWAQQVNGIQAMVPMPGGLVILTGQGAWQLNGGGSSSAVTPSSQQATAQAYNGCSALVRPLTINYDILYVQEQGSIVRDLNYNFYTNIYTGADITVLSGQLFDGYTIERWDWSEEPNKLLWAVRSDGALLCMTYLKEQEVYGWSRHDTQGLFKSVCCVNEPPVSAPYFVVRRKISGTWAYYIERMDNRLWTSIDDAWCVDSGLSYPHIEPAATLTISSATGDQNIGAYNLINGGSGYTAPIANVIDLENTGSGATLSLTVAGGVITAANVLTQGSDYTRPQVVITDSTGTGGVIQPVVTNYVTVSASASVFTSANIGDVIYSGGGKVGVVGYTSGTILTGNIIYPISQIIPDDDSTPIPQDEGDWSIVTPVSVVHGLDHLEGMSIVGLVDGSVVNDITVSGGSVTLPEPASSIVIGLPFTAQMQTLYFDAGQSNGPTVQGRRKNIYQLNIRVSNSRAPEAGADQPDSAVQPNGMNVAWSDMTLVKERGPASYAGQPVQLYSGDYFTDITSGWNANGQFAIQQEGPLPLNVLAIVGWLDVGDSPG